MITFMIYDLLSGSGSIQFLVTFLGTESISCSRCIIFCSRRSLDNALCIMAACAREPSGFLTIRT